MEVKQIYNLVNTATMQAIGETAVLQEDLSNLVDVGTEVFNANAYDNFTHALLDKIGRTIISDRVYKGSAPNILKSESEYGSVVEKISFDLPTADENESYELVHGMSYSQDIFTAPNIRVKFFNSKTTYEIQLSITDVQLRSAFTSIENMNKFLSGLYLSVQNSLTIKNDELIMRTINNMIGETLHVGGSARAVNLLSLYNTEKGTSLTATQAMSDKEFIRFAVYKMNLYTTRLQRASTLFNIGGTTKFTPKEQLHVVLLDEFTARASAYLESDTYHNELVSLPKFEKVSYWQGSGTDYSFSEISKIDVKLASDNTTSVTQNGIVGVMFDEDTLGVANFDLRIPTHYNAKAEFTNLFYKQDSKYYCDLNENFVVFYVA